MLGDGAAGVALVSVTSSTNVTLGFDGVCGPPLSRLGAVYAGGAVLGKEGGGRDAGGGGRVGEGCARLEGDVTICDVGVWWACKRGEGPSWITDESTIGGAVTTATGVC